MLQFNDRWKRGANEHSKASDDNAVKMWDASTRKELATHKDRSATLNSVAFSPDGRVLVSASDDKTVKRWDANTQEELSLLIGHSDAVNSVAFSPDGKTIATASTEGVGHTRRA
jgi:WD40 repeat protein